MPIISINPLNLAKLLLAMCIVFVPLSLISMIREPGPNQLKEYRTAYSRGLPIIRRCLLEEIGAENPETFWNKSTGIVNKCLAVGDLNMFGFNNGDETKFHIPSRLKDDDCTIVTLGIGRDTNSERKMAAMMPNCKFYGADPVSDYNEELFKKIGVFYQTAVGAKDGMMSQLVLESKNNVPEYSTKDVPTREIYGFLKEDLGLKVVDQLLIDIEKAEFELAPKLLRKNTPEDITICQINIEFHPHNKESRRIYYNFLKDITDEGHILPLRATTYRGWDVKRLYFLNIGDQQCLDRYFYHEPNWGKQSFV